MTWVLVTAMLIGGELQFSTIGPYETKAACEEGFAHLLNLYRRDGVPLAHLNGACFIDGDSK